ncbi:hybrid sensor histidine kinase/response regulator [Zhengella mangrovi]|uniref:histidine kinase n=1 Tax=Zhengella mangrovi TaxID=1982044 RepID=A0A2G1QII6_9HYPH|nr:response regulator [Zhengella mangrovi]PHP65343.1 hybrid sensor histidine kinase/response regulator [Zhengella mangrovi]
MTRTHDHKAKAPGHAAGSDRGHLGSDEVWRLLEAAADWVYELDAEGRFTWVSDSIRGSGVSPSMLVGYTREQVFSRIALSADQMAAHLSLISERKPFRDFRGAFTSRDGTFHYFITSGFPLFDEDGTFLGYRGVSRDVSALLSDEDGFTALQKQLDQSRKLLQSVFSSLEGGVIVYDVHDRLYMTNEAMRALYPDLDRSLFAPGTTLEAFLGALFDSGQVVHGPEADRGEWVAERVRRYQQPFEEYDVRLANGRWVRFSNKRMEDGTFIGLRTDITALKEREAALENALANASLANEVINGLDQAIFVKDEDLRFVCANRAMARTLDLEVPSINGKLAADLVARDLAEQFEASERAVLETGEPYMALESWEAGGETRWRTVRKNRIIAADGRTYVAGFLNDVTELKKGESEAAAARVEAEAARRRLQGAIDAMTDGFVLWDENDVLVACNDAFRKQFEFLPDLREGRTFSEMFLEFARSGIVAEAVGREEAWVAENGAKRAEEIGQEIVFKTHDGRWMMRRDEMTPLGDRVGIRTDITAVKEREEEARRANQLLQDAVDAMDQSFTIFGEDDRLTIANKAFLDSQEGAPVTVGMTFSQLVETLAFHHIESESGRWRWIRRQHALRDEALAHDGPMELNRSDGRWHLLDLRRTSTGTLLDIRMDITEAKEREIALNEARRKAELADRAKSEFLANMSHEIRTPMNGVLGMAELLAKTALSSKQRTFTDIIVKSGNALLTIINDILDFSKIDAGQLVLDPVPFTLAEAVEDVATLMSVRAKEKDLELIVRIDPNLRSSYVGDAGRVRQIITNLMGNAVKFTETGHVLVDVTGQDLGERSRLRISVSDTGIGIPDDKLQCVFEKFSQVDSSSTRRHEGTGLGLAITSRLADLMGGRIGAESELGEGSTFWVEIELENHGERARTVKTPVDITGARIIVIDDNEVNRSILMEQMQSWSFDACAAKDGREGMAILKAAAGYGLAVDCVVLDYQMPGMNGAQVAAAIRSDPKLADVSIILLSSVDQGLESELSARLGISASLVKPVRSSALLDAIVNAVQERRAGPSAPGQVFVAAQPPAVEVSVSEEERADPPDPAPEPAAAPVAATNDRHRIDILVAEDNEVNQLVLTQILADTGYSFKMVNNGELAVEAWDDMSPRLVLMDVSMPQMNGLEATAHIRRAEQRDGRARTPIVGVTAHALKGDRERCLESGMDDYLSKPISPDTLLRKVGEWLDDKEKTNSRFG